MSTRNLRAWRGLLAVLVSGLLVLTLAGCRPPDDQGDPDVAYILELLADGFMMPVGIFHAGDGTDRLFVVEQVGRILVVANGELLEEPFLDLRDVISDLSSDFDERGLLSMAFHPEYADNGRVYVSYTEGVNAGDQSVIARYLVDEGDPNRLDPNSGQEILTVAQPRSYHNGGLIAFGPDGYLYVALGDGGESGHGQDPGTMLGAMLRIDVDAGEELILTAQAIGLSITAEAGQTYAIPQENPWVDDNDFVDELWAIGLRNPWRFSFDRATGDLWIADVGQAAVEEVNLQPADSPGGENYGWPIYEGDQLYDAEVASATGEDLVMPVATYPIGGPDECAIAGGYVYRGAALTALQGRYFFGDWCSGKIWTLAGDGDDWVMELFLETDLMISAFGEDEAGELYVVDHDFTGTTGIYRLVLEE